MRRQQLAAGGAAGASTVTSFDFADEILRRLAAREVFPNLEAIVVSGHSAGGQFVTRYEMANRVHDTLGVPVRYVVANPSSYAYPDAARPGDQTSGVRELQHRGPTVSRIATGMPPGKARPS